MASKKHYLANADTAVCSECNRPCAPQIDSGNFDFECGSVRGVHSDGEVWTSLCHSAPMNDICGGEWAPDVCEGNPEP